MIKLLCILTLCVLFAVLLLVCLGVLPDRPQPWKEGHVLVSRMSPEGPIYGIVTNMRWERADGQYFGYWRYELEPVDND